MFVFTCCYGSRWQYGLTLETVVNMLVLICRFQAQDMEVQLSDELASSLRQLKVLHCFTCSLIHFDLCQEGHRVLKSN